MSTLPVPVLVAAVLCAVLALVAGAVFVRSAVIVPGAAAAAGAAVAVAFHAWATSR